MSWSRPSPKNGPKYVIPRQGEVYHKQRATSVIIRTCLFYMFHIDRRGNWIVCGSSEGDAITFLVKAGFYSVCVASWREAIRAERRLLLRTRPTDHPLAPDP